MTSVNPFFDVKPLKKMMIQSIYRYLFCFGTPKGLSPRFSQIAFYRLLPVPLVAKLLVFMLPVLLLDSGPTVAQNNDTGVYVDPNRSDRNWRTDLNIAGNDVESIITNYGTIGKGNESINQAGVWPRGTGHGHLHEMTGYVASRVEDTRGDKTIIISDGYRDGSGGSIDPVTEIEWKFQPLPGYFNRDIDNPRIATSTIPETWPKTWPGREERWDGQWNGYFGLNQFNADQETYYVMDDFWNAEYPFYPDATDSSKRGLGMQISVRLFQWSQALAKDIVFMQYEMTNTSTTTFSFEMGDNPIFMGGYTDTNPSGSGATDTSAGFDDNENMVFGWSASGVGLWTQFREIPPGYIGWKYLQSPGIANDGIDNDGDGLIDESQESPAGEYVFGPCGFYDEPQFRWTGDENCNWDPELHDCGSDGVCPWDPFYTGPTPDGTEGNGRPDQGEPNFGRLDNAEADQVGLTSFFAPLFGTVDINDEPGAWQRMQPGFFDIPQQSVNQIWIFASGPFNLRPGQTERYGTAFVFGANERALFRNAQVAQRIYDSNYQFARPPLQPEVTAIAADGKVILTWDDLAERSYDPVYGFDFQGYRIIKGTDPQFRDAKDITDALGNPVYKQSIAQFDIVNGLTGPHPLQLGEDIGQPTGIHYYMGDDTGLQHYFIDEDVVNGRAYYYAVISYDTGYDTDFYERGISELDNLFPISPSESPASITVTGGVITAMDRNTVRVVPNAQPTDIDQGRLETETQNRLAHIAGPSTGRVRVIEVASDLFDDNEYFVTFSTKPLDATVEYRTSTFTLTDGNGTVIIEDEPVPVDFGGDYRRNWTHEVLDRGFVLEFQNVETTLSNTQIQSGWSDESQTNIRTTIELTPSFAFPDPPLWPLTAVLEVGDPEGPALDSAFTSTTGNITRPVWFRLYEKYTGEKLPFILNEPRSTRNGIIDTSETLNILFKNKPDDARYAQSWTLRFDTPIDAEGNRIRPENVVLPHPGDRFVLRSEIPFGELDRYRFGSVARREVDDPDRDLLADVRVVPNPYIGANVMEGRPFLEGRGERKIEFRNLPSQARIRIYTAAGTFVQEVYGSNGVAEWNLRSKDNLEVAFGLYFYHLQAEGVGEKVGKFAIIN